MSLRCLPKGGSVATLALALESGWRARSSVATAYLDFELVRRQSDAAPRIRPPARLPASKSGITTSE